MSTAIALNLTPTVNLMVELVEPLLGELQDAAARVGLGLAAYVGEALEAHAASLRLPKVQFSVNGPTRDRRLELKDSSFPFPPDTYRLAIPRGRAQAE